MPDKLIPSIDQRLGSFMEIQRRRVEEDTRQPRKSKIRPTITISREFGCEAYPMAERLKELLEKKTGEKWLLMDKGLLEEVAKNHNLSEKLFHGLGEQPRFLDEVISTFSPSWRTERDYYKLLCKHIISLAEEGNVIIVGRGSAIITEKLENCHHFRMFASSAFKIRSISRRMEISASEAGEIVEKRQQQRDRFIKDFLNRDAHDLRYYNLIFNNDRNPSAKIAETIMGYVLSS